MISPVFRLILLLDIVYVSSLTINCGSSFQNCANQALLNSGEYVCIDDYSCTGSNIVSTGRIECQGKDSCHVAIDLNATTNVECNGMNSCRRARYIRADSNLYCRGDYSCAYISYSLPNINPLVFGQDIYCSGSNSCTETTMSAQGNVQCEEEYACLNSRIYSNDKITCADDRSCTFTNLQATNTIEFAANTIYAGTWLYSATAQTIYAKGERCLYYARDVSANNIYLEGQYALQYGTIKNKGKDINIYVTGSYSGTGGTIICEAGKQCNLYCNSNDGCDGLTFDCSLSTSTNDCKVINPSRCTSGAVINGIRCPTMI